MKKLQMDSLLKKSLKELVKERAKLKKQLFEYRMKNAVRALNQTHLIRLARRNIARLNTAISLKTKSA